MFSIKPPQAKVIRRVHFWMMALWIVVGIPVSYFLRQSLVWLVVLSVYAIVAAHAAGWSAEHNEDENDA